MSRACHGVSWSPCLLAAAALCLVASTTAMADEPASVDLVPEPESGEVSVAPSPAAEPPPAVSGVDLAPGGALDAPASGPDYRLIVGVPIATLGVGMVVSLIVIAARVSQLDNDTGFQNYRRGFTPDQSACTQARSGVEVPGAATAASVAALCDEADTLQILSAMAFPAGVALLTLGGYLIFGSDTVSGPKGDARVQLLPHVGADGGGAALRVSF